MCVCAPACVLVSMCVRGSFEPATTRVCATPPCLSIYGVVSCSSLLLCVKAIRAVCVCVCSQVEKSLPPKNERILRVEMTPLQKQYYKVHTMLHVVCNVMTTKNNCGPIANLSVSSVVHQRALVHTQSCVYVPRKLDHVCVCVCARVRVRGHSGSSPVTTVA